MALTEAQRELLDGLSNFTEDTFLTSQYASLLLPRLQQFTEAGTPLTPDDALQWAREREWIEIDAGWLAGVAWAVRYGSGVG
jgi:hypothetical protein